MNIELILSSQNSEAEKKINEHVKKLYGGDARLMILVKLHMMREIGIYSNEFVDDVIEQIRMLNKIDERELVSDMNLTYDKDGNVIFVNELSLEIEEEKK